MDYQNRDAYDLQALVSAFPVFQIFSKVTSSPAGIYLQRTWSPAENLLV